MVVDKQTHPGKWDVVNPHCNGRPHPTEMCQLALNPSAKIARCKIKKRLNLSRLAKQSKEY